MDISFDLPLVLQETTLREQVEGLEEEESDEEAIPNDGGEGEVAVGATTLALKKTERQRKREKAEKVKVQTPQTRFKDG